MNEQLIMHQEFCFRAEENVQKRGTIKYVDAVIRARCCVAVGMAASKRDSISFMSLCRTKDLTGVNAQLTECKRQR